MISRQDKMKFLEICQSDDYLMLSLFIRDLQNRGLLHTPFEREQMTPLLYAVRENHTVAVEVIVSISLPGCTEEFETALLDASKSVCMEIVEILLKHGTNPNAVDVNNCTPLILASKSPQGGSLATVQLLLDYGTDIHAKSLNEMDALMMAIFSRNVDIAEMLLKHGARVHRQVYSVIDLVPTVKTELLKILKKYETIDV